MENRYFVFALMLTESLFSHKPLWGNFKGRDEHKTEPLWSKSKKPNGGSSHFDQQLDVCTRRMKVRSSRNQTGRDWEPESSWLLAHMTASSGLVCLNPRKKELKQKTWRSHDRSPAAVNVSHESLLCKKRLWIQTLLADCIHLRAVNGLQSIRRWFIDAAAAAAAAHNAY